jgi:uncharacterized PurR-regulated membrane protein YhhQ (DUF165 family)
MLKKPYLLIGMYMAAIVAANLLVARFGPSVTVVNAFLFIGLDLSSRDRLHDMWHGKHLWGKMALLVLTGSALTVLLNWSAWRIAGASCAAFAAAATVDTITYHLLRGKTRLVRMNGSNVFSAAVDSIAFPALAFGFPLLFGVMAGQFAAKVGGGFVWSLILRGRHDVAATGEREGVATDNTV